MAATTEFLLERMVHQVLKGDPARGRCLVTEALDAGLSASSLIADILWPAMECVEQLQEDGTITGRIYNMAMRVLRSLSEGAALRLKREPENGRSVFTLTAPGETSELGSHVLSTLAEAHGWRVFFAGAGLTLEELTFSIGQLGPEVILIHGSLAISAGRVRELVRQLHRIRIWPSVQVVVAGGVLGHADLVSNADLVGRHPVEILELMTMWPEYRVKAINGAPASPGAALQMLGGSTAELGISAELVREMMRRHFGKRGDHPN